MKLQDPLPRTQQPLTYSCIEPEEYVLDSPIIFFFQNSFQYYPPIYTSIMSVATYNNNKNFEDILL